MQHSSSDSEILLLKTLIFMYPDFGMMSHVIKRTSQTLLYVCHFEVVVRLPVRSLYRTIIGPWLAKKSGALGAGPSSLSIGLAM